MISSIGLEVARRLIGGGSPLHMAGPSSPGYLTESTLSDVEWGVVFPSAAEPQPRIWNQRTAGSSTRERSPIIFQRSAFGEKAHFTQCSCQVSEETGEALRFAVPDRSLASSVTHVLSHARMKN